MLGVESIHEDPEVFGDELLDEYGQGRIRGVLAVLRRHVVDGNDVRREVVGACALAAMPGGKLKPVATGVAAPRELAHPARHAGLAFRGVAVVEFGTEQAAVVVGRPSGLGVHDGILRRALQRPGDLALAPTVAALNAGVHSVGTGRADVLADLHPEAGVVLLGDEVDHAADGVGTVHGRAAVQLHVNPFNGRERHVQEVDVALLVPRPTGNAAPVYKHQRVGRTQRAQVGRRSAETRDDLEQNEARRAVVDEPRVLIHVAWRERRGVDRGGLLVDRVIGPGQRAHQFFDARHAPRFEIVHSEAVDEGRGVALGQPGAGHHYGFDVVRVVDRRRRWVALGLYVVRIGVLAPRRSRKYQDGGREHAT